MPRKAKATSRGVFQRPDGPGAWWIRYQRNGKLKRERVGGSKQDAIDLYQQRKTELRAGAKLPANLKDTRVQFDSLIDAILVYSQRKHKDTRNVASRCEIIRAEFGTWAADAIQPDDIETWLHKRSRTNATFNIYRSLFSLIFRQAVRNGKVKRNPARDVEMRSVNNGRIRQLHRHEQEKLEEVVKRLYPERWPELVISLGTGMRLSEQYGLTWSAVDLRNEVIDLRETKNGVPRLVHMGPAVRDAFLAMRDQCMDTGPNGRVFLNKSPRKWFTQALEKAEIAGYRWHDNRHTFCSRLGQNGAHIKTIQQLAGHKTIQMSARYTHMDDVTLRNAVSGLV